MSDNWVVQNLENALEVWNDKLSEIWQLITQSPQTFKGGSIWSIICSIHGALQAIGYALLVLFFVVGVVKTCGSFAELKKPEHAVKLFVRFAIAKGFDYLRHGADDGDFGDYSGRGQYDHEFCRLWKPTGHGAAAGDHHSGGGLWIL